MPLSLSLGLGLSSRNTGGGFSLAAFMAAQSNGFWYDFTQTDRLFQEAAGPTPANDPNEVIGLALDQRSWAGKTCAQVVASQTSIVLNGDFAGATGWTTAANWAIGGGLATASVGSAGYLTSNSAANIGSIYQVDYEYTYVSGGGIQAVLGSISDSAIGSAGSAARRFFPLATATTGFQTFANSANATIDNVSARLIPGKPALQTTTSFKPKFQTTGAAFDGADDNLLTGYLASATANFIAAKVTVPATLAALQILFGESGAGTDRCFLGINTSGQLCGGVGTQSTSTILGSTDLRGREVIVGLSFDGSTVRLFADAAQQYSAAQAGVPSASIPFRVGAANNSGSASSFFAGSIKSVVTGREFIDLARFLQIANAL